MRIKQEVDITEIIMFDMDTETKKDLAKEIILEMLGFKDGNQFMAEILKDFRGAEEEFENRKRVLKAYDTVIEAITNY